MTPLFNEKTKHWFCGNCFNDIDCDFIPPRYCDHCLIRIDWDD